MSRKPYTPKPGSLAKRVTAYLTANQYLKLGDFQEVMGVTQNNVGPGLKAGLEHGYFKAITVDGRRAYALGDGTPPTERQAVATISANSNGDGGDDNATGPEDDAAPASDLTITRWSDGDVFVAGLDLTEDGQTRLTPPQLQQLVDFLCVPAVQPRGLRAPL